MPPVITSYSIHYTKLYENLVGLGSVREMGAMMTAIIMAGRTGSAYAAQLGTMQANDEIDALRTFGILV